MADYPVFQCLHPCRSAFAFPLAMAPPTAPCFFLLVLGRAEAAVHNPLGVFSNALASGLFGL
ncbi:BQ5605_C004g03057 [Microbotryum silenes-dioicae]|uniref:BQ5605_C004g03057 protein n=1 Tax=Microbotryum silenes-dioicae TaxID=796604 RepID=A0A2X0MDQ9_9BASI|nr:BQ5605_C004g03057 [Microbotryum silenes-dioicae]